MVSETIEDLIEYIYGKEKGEGVRQVLEVSLNHALISVYSPDEYCYDDDLSKPFLKHFKLMCDSIMHDFEESSNEIKFYQTIVRSINQNHQ